MIAGTRRKRADCLTEQGNKQILNEVKNKQEPEYHHGLRGLSTGANISAHLCSS